MTSAHTGYLPIEDHGIVGNLRTAALVGIDGTIDWLCLPELDSPPVFASLLDAGKGGRFSIRASGAGPGEQRYLPETNVLQTSFRCPEGLLNVTDFMPVSGTIGHPTGSGPPEIHRIVTCEDGTATLQVEWSPRFGWERKRPQIELVDGGAVAWHGPHRVSLRGLGAHARIESGPGGPMLSARFELRAGETRALVVRWESSCAPYRQGSGPALEETVRSWKQWSRHMDRLAPGHWSSRHPELLSRSEMVLKLLTHADSGAIAAAATTSLPESMGGVRNWDYRYSWIRDASRSTQALVAVGHRDEAVAFLNWIQRVSHRSGRIQIMYGLHGQSDLTERELPQLEGYRGSRPVRIGNGAAQQFQLDTYGDILCAAHQAVHHGETLGDELAGFMAWLADRACDRWREPDHGIWEVRDEPRHFLHSKVMVWAALNRAVRMHHAGQLHGNVERWKREQSAVRRAVLEEGYSPRLGSFVQSFGSDDIDATCLFLPLVGFLPATDPRMLGTIDRVKAELLDRGLVRRYLRHDGLPGREGAFLLCTFWLVDVLALAGRVDEAEALCEGVAGRANHLGLFSEEIDPDSGAFLGNFPQGFSHLGLINAMVTLAHAEGRLAGEPPEYVIAQPP